MNRIVFTIVLMITGSLIAQENYQIKNIEANTKYSDFGVNFYQGDAVFASSRPIYNKSKTKWTNGLPYLDLYRGKISSDGELVDIKSFSEDIETQYHESNVVFTKDGKTVYFTRNNYYKDRYGRDSLGWNNLKLFRADINEKGEWINEKPLPFNNDNYSVGHPALSPDEKTLYFISNMPGTLGQTDIFKTIIGTDGQYSTPVNLGSQVNTPGKEMFPNVTKSGKMYFSSDGMNGLGNLDVYVVPLNNNTILPLNLGAPINSANDDFAFIIDENKHTGYFSSNREDGKGNDDIYFFRELKEPIFTCKQDMAGVVKDMNTGALLPYSTVTLYKGNTEIETVTVGEDASFLFSGIDCKTEYKLVATKDNYQGDQKIIMTNEGANAELKLALELVPEKESDRVTYLENCQNALDTINSIYFDLDEYYIRPDAANELDKIVLAMNKCKDIVIEAKSHTDSRASHEYNRVLSQNRAQATVDYIVSKGIDKNRIVARGYGETQLVNQCRDGVNCTEKEHQQNRRSEFKIINE